MSKSTLSVKEHEELNNNLTQFLQKTLHMVCFSNIFTKDVKKRKICNHNLGSLLYFGNRGKTTLFFYNFFLGVSLWVCVLIQIQIETVDSFVFCINMTYKEFSRVLSDFFLTKCAPKWVET